MASPYLSIKAHETQKNWAFKIETLRFVWIELFEKQRKA